PQSTSAPSVELEKADAEGSERPESKEKKLSKILVWKVLCNENVPRGDAELISGFVSSEVERRSGASVISEEEIKTLIEGERVKQQCKSNEPSCMADIGNALGVDEAVTGELGIIGSFWLFNLRRINVRNAEVVKRVSVRVEGHVDGLMRQLPGLVAELYGQQPEADTPPGQGFIGAQHQESEHETGGGVPQDTTGQATAGSEIAVTQNRPEERSDGVALTTIAGHVLVWGGVAIGVVGAGAAYKFLETNEQYRNGDFGKQQEAENWATVAIASGLVAAAGVAGGVLLWLLAPEDEEPESPEPGVDHP
ncbi:MAG: hypothetical protein JRI68_25560, partial [Deltaproteobacteria bacterium]|nr:hypothetical protein [Deltaproteobacteria bacterium]